MKASKIIAWVGFVAMTVGLMNGFLNGDFFKDGGELFQNPWGIMSLIDLYVGFTLFSMWIAYRERFIPVAVAWIIGMMVLGFFTACVYVLLGLYTSKGDWLKFFLGYQKEALIEGELAKRVKPEVVEKPEIPEIPEIPVNSNENLEEALPGKEENE